MYRWLCFHHIPAILSFSHDPISTCTSKIMTSALETAFAPRYTLPTNALPPKKWALCRAWPGRKVLKQQSQLQNLPLRGNDLSKIQAPFCQLSQQPIHYATKLWADIHYGTPPNLSLLLYDDKLKTNCQHQKVWQKLVVKVIQCPSHFLKQHIQQDCWF